MSKIDNSDIGKLLGVGALSLGLNYFIKKKFNNTDNNQQIIHKKLQSQIVIKDLIQQQKLQVQQLTHNKQTNKYNKQRDWGNLCLVQGQNDFQQPLIKQLKMMDVLLFDIRRVNNLVVDLKLSHFKPYKNHLIVNGIKKNKDQPFLSQENLITPGQFILKQCKFTPSNTLQVQKKYLRAGPRRNDFFKPQQVHADIVCLGGVSPGVNTVIRQIVLMLKNLHNVPKVYGIKNSLKGYYQNDIIQLNQDHVKTIHHNGGCFLGLSKTQFYVKKIIDSLIKRKVNQLYIIGAKSAMPVCKQIHKYIKQNGLTIAVCLILKGVNRDIPIFDTCFGFQTAVQQSAKIIQKAYNFSHSQQNGISLVKLNGYKTGFLASNAVLSTVNANICLVPQFQYDFHGKNGIFASILCRIKKKGSCTIVYAHGVQNSIRDVVFKKNSDKQNNDFDDFLSNEIQKKLKQNGIDVFSIGLFNAIQTARSAPANAIDTKLCCQIAQSSIMGVMSGYTNFAIGHLSYKSTMISVDDLILQQQKTVLKQNDDIWIDTVMSTGQSRMLNSQYKTIDTSSI